MTASEDSLQKLIYQLFKAVSTYALTLSAAKTKILPLKGKDLVRAKIVTNNIIEQVTIFNYLGLNWAVIEIMITKQIIEV
jgi:hypothetical protein